MNDSNDSLDMLDVLLSQFIETENFKIKTPILTWELVKSWRNELSHCEGQILENLENNWEYLSKKYEIINREDENNVGETPLDAFFYYADAGYYPPPEIMLAMNDAFRCYIESKGKLSLEDVFYGRQIQRSGNHSKRINKRNRDMIIKLTFQGLINTGVKRMDAAEMIAEKLNNNPEPESILRMVRNVKPYKETEK